MKKLIILMIVATLGGNSYGQYDKKAKEILDAMSAKYKKIPAYKAKFVTSLVNDIEGINEKFVGEITVKNNKYFLKTEDQEVINDGKTVWTYLPDVNEVNIDIYSPEDNDISPSTIFDEYKKGYKFIWLKSTTLKGKKTDVIDLIPNKSANSQFFKIKMLINAKDKTLHKWTMYEKGGNKYIYTISNFKTYTSVPESTFKFDTKKYPGVEVIDLR